MNLEKSQDSKEKLVLIIDRYEGDIRSTPKYLQMLRENLPEGYELVLMSDKEIRGLEFDQIWIDELNALEVKEVLSEPVYKPKPNESPYWQRGRW